MRTLGWSDDPSSHGSYRGTQTWFEAGTSASSTRILIQENVHASKEIHVHTQVWRHDDHSAVKRNWIQSIHRGDRLDVYAKARYMGWVNNVKSVKIIVECAV